MLAQRAASEGPRWTRAVEDQSAPILEERVSEFGRESGETSGMVSVLAEPHDKKIGRTPTVVLCSRNTRPEKGLVRRPHVDQHGYLSKRGTANNLGRIIKILIRDTASGLIVIPSLHTWSAFRPNRKGTISRPTTTSLLDAVDR